VLLASKDLSLHPSWSDCPSCSAPREDLHHLFLQCPGYTQERTQLWNSIKESMPETTHSIGILTSLQMWITGQNMGKFYAGELPPSLDNFHSMDKHLTKFFKILPSLFVTWSWQIWKSRCHLVAVQKKLWSLRNLWSIVSLDWDDLLDFDFDSDENNLLNAQFP